MAGIQVPKGQIAEFDEAYQSRIGPLNDFEKVTFYSDFTRLIGNTILTPSMQEQVRQFFQICFVEDMTSIDLLCAEVFLQPNPTTMTPPSDKQPKKKRARNYNSPLQTMHCNNCEEKDLRFKLVKKMMNCNKNDLLKFAKFSNDLKTENALLAALPPLNEINDQLHTQLIIALENRTDMNDAFISEFLPNCVDLIKIAWYKLLRVPQQAFNVPETPSDTSV